MDVGPLPEMPCWEELRAGCLMSFCEGDSDPGRPGVPRCYCEHQFWLAAFGKPHRDLTTISAEWEVMATEEPGRTVLVPCRRARPVRRLGLLRVIRAAASRRRVV
jgi:hypothetical protein